MESSTRRTDPLQQFFEKLNSFQSTGRNLPYLILLQHSLSFQLRQAASNISSFSEENVLYRKAGFRTPAENSSRDLEAGVFFLQHIVNQLLSNNATSVILLKTGTSSTQQCISRIGCTGASNLHVIDVSKFADCFHFGSESGPSSWKEILAQVDSKVQSLSSPETSASTPVRIPLIFDSVTPIILHHGPLVAVRLLERLLEIPHVSPVIVPVMIESLTPSQHRTLEDAAHAVLCLSGGDAMLLRQGIREKDNFVKEEIPYRIVTNHQGRRCFQIISNQEEATTKPTDNSSNRSSLATSSSQEPSSTTTTGRRPRVQLRMAQGDTPRDPVVATPPTARIFVQEDDPEFQDYDEEEPDDDLDI